MRPLSLPAIASITSVCCGTMTGVELTPCDRNSAAIVDHPRPADDFRSAESGYFFAPCVCKSIVTCLTVSPTLKRRLTFSFVVSSDGRSARIEDPVVTQRGEKHFTPTP